MPRVVRGLVFHHRWITEIAVAHQGHCYVRDRVGHKDPVGGDEQGEWVFFQNPDAHCESGWNGSADAAELHRERFVECAHIVVENVHREELLFFARREGKGAACGAVVHPGDGRAILHHVVYGGSARQIAYTPDRDNG